MQAGGRGHVKTESVHHLEMGLSGLLDLINGIVLFHPTYHERSVIKIESTATPLYQRH